MTDLNGLKAAVLAITSLAVIDLTAIAVITQFKTSSLVNSTQADEFIAGLLIFGSFVGVLALGLIGKVIFDMFK
jgi:hypothetical protein